MAQGTAADTDEEIHIKWPSAATRAEPLETGQVHVWASLLDVPAVRREALEASLSMEERRRSERSRIARGLLRELLGGYLDAAPVDVALSMSDRGKPVLRDADRNPIEFSVSHSGGLALYAFARGVRIGVDVERIRPMRDVRGLAERVLSRAEFDAFERLDAPERARAFFATWTRKEAFVKARGTGIAGQLDRFDVSVHPAEPARLLRVEGEAAAASGWTLAPLDPATGFAATVAVEATGATLLCRRC